MALSLNAVNLTWQVKDNEEIEKNVPKNRIKMFM